MKILDLGIRNQSSFHDDRIPFFLSDYQNKNFKKKKNIFFFFKTNPVLLFFQHSYGFIQCCDRQARLFFHFSQFDGNIEHLKIGDPVEFEMTYDRRTGKPIASTVSKIAPEVVLREERVIGTVTTEVNFGFFEQVFWG